MSAPRKSSEAALTAILGLAACELASLREPPDQLPLFELRMLVDRSVPGCETVRWVTISRSATSCGTHSPADYRYRSA